MATTESATTRSNRTAEVPVLTGARRGSVAGLRYLAMFFAGVAVVVMIPLAGVGVFGLENRSFEDATAFIPHSLVGLLLWVVTLLMIILAVIARPGALLIVLPIVMFVQLFLQGPFLGLGDAITAMGWVHPLNGLIAAGLAGLIVVRAGDRLRGPHAA